MVGKESENAIVFFEAIIVQVAKCSFGILKINYWCCWCMLVFQCKMTSIRC